MNLRFDHISFTHTSRLSGEVPVFQDLSMDVRSGECVGIIGPEGAGKSTLLMLAAGLSKPASGAIKVWREGEEEAAAPHNRRLRIGVTFQIPELQFFRATIREELEDVLAARGEEPDPSRSEAALEAAGLPPSAFLDRSPFTLSMGEGRRLAFALLQLQQPELALLDEPTAGLDAAGIRRVREGILDLNRKGATVLVVSHDLDVLAGLVTRLVLISEGKILVSGPASSVITESQLLRRIGFDPPAIVRLAEKARELDPDLPPGIPSLEALRAVFARSGNL